MEHVATEPLSRMTFRSLASALGVSTYSFIYHFGSRQQMVDAILEEAVRQQSESALGVDIAAFDREQFADWYRAAFRRSLSESNRTSLRLEFEAGALEPIDPDLGTRITSSFRDWLAVVQRWLTANGVEKKRAAVLARWLADTAAGLRFGYLMTGDREKTVSAFDLFLGAYLREAVGP
ncbi:TetR/AcrR family transcriptional regulator [Leifsonia sp. NPDC102414]|uniref:TetR/AcrR family transcriptional regulator n=1 Tax=Leifsonia sp. NPDC102414 TaxID=3364124 RepID=UPI0037F5FABA